LANGHSDAFHYPLGRLFDESNIVLERDHGQMRVDAVLAQHAFGAVMSKRGGSSLRTFLKKLDFETKATQLGDKSNGDSDIWG